MQLRSVYNDSRKLNTNALCGGCSVVTKVYVSCFFHSSIPCRDQQKTSQLEVRRKQLGPIIILWCTVTMQPNNGQQPGCRRKLLHSSKRCWVQIKVLTLHYWPLRIFMLEPHSLSHLIKDTNKFRYFVCFFISSFHRQRQGKPWTSSQQGHPLEFILKRDSLYGSAKRSLQSCWTL